MAFQSVATNQFQTLSVDQVIDANFNTTEAFWRSIKVFLVSFAGYEDSNTQLFSTKFQEYVNVMKELFEVPNIDMSRLVDIKRGADNHDLELKIGILRVKGLALCEDLRVYLNVGPEMTGEMYLNMNSEIQDHICDFPLNYRTLLKMKSFNVEIKYMAEADNWTNVTEPLNQFTIRMREISAEGFEEWFDFGRGVQMLIKIETVVVSEPHSDPDWTTQFHLHAIYKMLCRQYTDLNANTTDSHRKHKSTATKVKMSYLRGRVNPSSEMSYWRTERVRTEMSDVLQRVRDGLESGLTSYKQMGDVFGRTVKYIDLQISLYYHDQYKDNVCLCSQWCNLNAFFHYNPIYRCLLVNHAQLFMEDKTNIADMYLFSVCSLEQLSENQNNPLYTEPETPVFRLIDCANYYRNYNYQNYYLKLLGWKQKYRGSNPPFQHLIGLSYKILRESTLIAEFLIQSDADPFADNCLDNLIKYYNVIFDLHTLVGQIDTYVPTIRARDWFKEFNRISRQNYSKYIVTAFSRKLIQQLPSYDFLFSEDYEYSDVFAPTEDHKRIQEQREKINKLGSPRNPLNMRVILSPIASTFALIYKTINKVEPRMTTPTTGQALKDVFDTWKTFDVNFKTFIVNNSFTFHTELEEVTTDPTELQKSKHLFVFYTLKLYLMSFAINRQCIESLINWNSHSSEDFRQQVCTEFVFIWRFDVIERKYRDLFQEDLYSNPMDISVFFIDFYDTFWGKADHETNSNPSVDECWDSAYYEYHKLYFWANNGNDTRLKFRVIIDNFGQIQTEVSDRTQEIYETYIIDAILSIQDYENHIEVFDTLVYYLVKAFCCVILSTTSLFVVEWHKLQKPSLVADNVSYTLTKPGIITLLKTMFGTFDKLENIRQLFVVFDDENNRIGNALDVTKAMIKDIYRQFFQKLMKEWVEELDLIYNQGSNIQLGHLGGLHIASGLSVASAFIDNFRMRARKSIKLCQLFMTVPPDQTIVQQVFIHDCGPVCETYLTDHNAIRVGQPFLTPIWQNRLNAVFTEFNQNVGQLNLDMSVADVHI